MVVLKIGNYYVRTDTINYFHYEEEEDETCISCSGVWFSVKGDYTKQITEELRKAENIKIVKLGE